MRAAEASLRCHELLKEALVEVDKEEDSEAAKATAKKKVLVRVMHGDSFMHSLCQPHASLLSSNRF